MDLISFLNRKLILTVLQITFPLQILAQTAFAEAIESAEIVHRHQLPTPRGHNTVGVATRIWTDPSRKELADRRNGLKRVTVRIWYPSRHDAKQKAPYLSNHKLYESYFGPKLSRLMGSVTTNAVSEGRPASTQEGYPLVLLSPGFGTAVNNYTLFCEEIASHGYVVVCIGHTYMNLVELPTAGLIDPTNSFWHDWPVAENRAMSIEQRKAQLQTALEQFAADHLFVIEKLKEVSRIQDSSEIPGKIDFSRTASIGHSAGYLAPLGLMIAPQSQQAYVFVDATLDEPPFTPLLKTHIKGPALLLRTEYATLPGESFLENIKAPLYEVDMLGIGHGAITDFPFLESVDHQPRHKAIERVRILCDYTMAFLETFLESESSSSPSLNAGENLTAQFRPLSVPLN